MPSRGDETRAFRGATGDRWFWLLVAAQRTDYVPFSSGSVVSAEGGYLGTARQGGLWPGSNQQQTEDLTVTFHEIRFG